MMNINSENESNLNTPFLGRETIYARLQQHILDPPHRHAILFTGHQGIGKSTLLHRFPLMFENQIFGIYIDLSKLSLANLPELSQELLRLTNDMLAEHDFTLDRVPQESDEETSVEDWFCDVYLYEVTHMIRPQRRIVWLMDDAQHLFEKPDILNYFHRLLQTHLQLGIILTLDTKFEQQLDALEPLIDSSKTERLLRLTKADTIEIIRQYAPGASDEIVETVFEATGGYPYLVSQFGHELHQAWVTSADSEAVKKARPRAYTASDSHFRHQWQLLSQNERLVLTAMASLIYEDPIAKTTPQRIEAWLVETDYPLDMTAIHAALRGLDYQEIVENQRNEGLKLVAGMSQTWLLEHARLSDIVVSASGFKIDVSRQMIIAIVVVLIAVILGLVILPEPTLDNSRNIPTVTLGQ